MTFTPWAGQSILWQIGVLGEIGNIELSATNSVTVLHQHRV